MGELLGTSLSQAVKSYFEDATPFVRECTQCKDQFGNPIQGTGYNYTKMRHASDVLIVCVPRLSWDNDREENQRRQKDVRDIVLGDDLAFNDENHELLNYKCYGMVEHMGSPNSGTI